MTAIMVADKYISKIKSVPESELDVVSDWFIDHKLSLHFGKTKSIYSVANANLCQNLIYVLNVKVFY